MNNKEKFELIRDWYNDPTTSEKERVLLRELCPELQESDDEKIRKALLQFFKEKDEEDFEGWVPKAKVLAWLEKQNMGISEATKKELEDNLNKALEKETQESWNEFLDEQKPLELKEESEDDKIRKAIISYIDYEALRGGEWFGVKVNDIIAWLEKQEQKPVISDDALREGIAHFGITQYQIEFWLKKYVVIDFEKKELKVLE